MRQTFGVIVTTRSFFPNHLADTARQEIAELLDRLGYGCIMLPKEATETGAVLTYSDAKACARLFREHRDEIDGVIVVLPNFGEELGVAEAVELAGLQVPVLIQACDDDFDRLDMANRRDAFCGKLSLCNNLYQRGIPFTGTILHTCPIHSPEFEKDVHRFAGVCRVVRGLKGSRIAMLGSRPLAFHTVRYSEKILQRYGIGVQTVDLSEVMAAAENWQDEEAVCRKAEEIRGYGRIPSYIDDEKIIKQAKFCLAVDHYVEELQCQASTVQCWDSLENNYGCAACLAMSMQGEKGCPSACESDVTGAVSMLAAQLAAQSPPALMDWNNNVREDRNCCVALHCANFPKSFFENPDMEIECLDVLGSTLGKENTFGACKGQVAAGPMTFLRLSTDDVKGVLKAYVGEGEFEKEEIPTKGGVAHCHVEGLQELMHYICRNGFEHHVCFVRGHVADILEEALGNYLGIPVYRHRG